MKILGILQPTDNGWVWETEPPAEEKEIFELDQVFRSPEEEEKFITFHGYPVKHFRFVC